VPINPAVGALGSRCSEIDSRTLALFPMGCKLAGSALIPVCAELNGAEGGAARRGHDRLDDLEPRLDSAERPAPVPPPVPCAGAPRPAAACCQQGRDDLKNVLGVKTSNEVLFARARPQELNRGRGMKVAEGWGQLRHCRRECDLLYCCCMTEGKMARLGDGRAA
jgi:hypothetical protein